MGKHLLLEVYDVGFEAINDVESLQNVMLRGIERAGMTVLNVFSHCFLPQGCTVVIALAESHVSCHTWPENGCLAVDVYTCGEGNPRLIALEILKYLDSDQLFSAGSRTLNRSKEIATSFIKVLFYFLKQELTCRIYQSIETKIT